MGEMTVDRKMKRAWRKFFRHRMVAHGKHLDKIGSLYGVKRKHIRKQLPSWMPFAMESDRSFRERLLQSTFKMIRREL